MRDDPSTRPQVTLVPGKHKRAERGHPWIYSNEVVLNAAAKALPAGSLVTVRNAEGKSLGVASFNPAPLITCRIITRDWSVKIDRGFLVKRLERALALRDRLFPEPYYRLVHAEADGLPGLIIDRYGTAVVCQLNTAWASAMEDDILAALDEVLAPEVVVFRNDSHARTMEGLPTETRFAKGSLTGPLEVRENGSTFLADLSDGQKTGWFFDQRPNRGFIAGLAQGQRVLDCYSFTGGFGIQAAVAGAAEVTLLDRSEPALALAKRAAELNGVTGRCKILRGEVFETFTKVHAILKEKYFLNPKEEEEDPYESSQITTLVANPHGIFGIYSLREVFVFDRFWGIGSGRNFALGAMFVAYEQDLDAHAIAEIGVRAGIEFDKSSGAPYQVHTIDRIQTTTHL